MQIGHRKEIRDYGGQFTLSTQLIKPNYLVLLPPTQHHSFFRNLPPLYFFGGVLEEPAFLLFSQGGSVAEWLGRRI